MPPFTFIALTPFIFLAIVGGIIGIILEGRRIPAGSGAHTIPPPTTLGIAALFALIRKS